MLPYRVGIRGFCLLVFAWVAFGCVDNFSADIQIVNPPVIQSVEAEGTGHIIRVGVFNTEVGFAGYRLFTGATADEAQNAPLNSGSDCGPLAVIPNISVEYIIEVKPGITGVDSSLGGFRLCAIDASLTAGQFVALRSLIFQNLTSLGVSISSNAAQVP